MQQTHSHSEPRFFSINFGELQWQIYITKDCIQNQCDCVLMSATQLHSNKTRIGFAASAQNIQKTLHPYSCTSRTVALFFFILFFRTVAPHVHLFGRNTASTMYTFIGFVIFIFFFSFLYPGVTTLVPRNYRYWRLSVREFGPPTVKLRQQVTNHIVRFNSLKKNLKMFSLVFENKNTAFFFNNLVFRYVKYEFTDGIVRKIDFQI